jgi:hypothetical protein
MRDKHPDRARVPDRLDCARHAAGGVMAKRSGELDDDSAPFRALGRPFPRVAFSTPIQEVHAMIYDRWFPLSLETLRRGGRLVIAGDWRSEPLLHHALSLLLTRLRREGHSVAVGGHIHVTCELPAADDDVVVVLDAPAFRSLPEAPVPGRLTVITGSVEEIESLALNPDITLTAPRRPWSEEIWNKVRDEVRTLLLSENPLLRRAALVNALGVDFSTQLVEGRFPPAFLPIESLEGGMHPWLTLRGQWMTRDVFRELLPANPRRWDADLDATLALAEKQHGGNYVGRLMRRVSMFFSR